MSHRRPIAMPHARCSTIAASARSGSRFASAQRPKPPPKLGWPREGLGRDDGAALDLEVEERRAVAPQARVRAPLHPVRDLDLVAALRAFGRGVRHREPREVEEMGALGARLRPAAHRGGRRGQRHPHQTLERRQRAGARGPGVPPGDARDAHDLPAVVLQAHPEAVEIVLQVSLHAAVRAAQLDAPAEDPAAVVRPGLEACSGSRGHAPRVTPHAAVQPSRACPPRPRRPASPFPAASHTPLDDLGRDGGVPRSRPGASPEEPR